MACGGNSMSDERIGAALAKVVIEKELENASSKIPPLISPSDEVQTEQERKLVEQLSALVLKIGHKLQDDTELKHMIDGMPQAPGPMWENFKKVEHNVFKHGITWENIAVLFYVAGRLAVRLVEAHLPQSVKGILTWTVDFFKNKLLRWIREHGGWINSFPELVKASMQTEPLRGFHTGHLFIIFVAGLALGSVISRKLA